MKRSIVGLLLPLLLAPSLLGGQTVPQSYPPTSANGQKKASSQIVTQTKAAKVKKQAPQIKPLSRFAVGAGFGVMGVNMQAAVNLNSHMNLRGVGNFLNYNINNINTNGLNINGNLNMATGGVAVDLFPFARHGFRISPGVMLYNQNAVSANVTVQGGQSFTLNNQTFYSDSADPVTGAANFGFHSQSPAFTLTTGYGNIIPRKGGHVSFPFELGVGFVGTPTTSVLLTGGQVCPSPQDVVGCQPVLPDPTLQNALQAQVNKYKSNLDPLKTFPIVSFGIAYSFNLR